MTSHYASLLPYTIQPSRLHPFSANFQADRTPSPRTPPYPLFNIAGDYLSDPWASDSASQLPLVGLPRRTPTPITSRDRFVDSPFDTPHLRQGGDLERSLLFTFDSHFDGVDSYVTFRQPSPTPTSTPASRTLTPTAPRHFTSSRPATPAPTASNSLSLRAFPRKRKDRKKKSKAGCWEPSLSTIWEIDQRYWRQWGFNPSPTVSPLSSTEHLSPMTQSSGSYRCPESPSPLTSLDAHKTLKFEMQVEEVFEDGTSSRKSSLETTTSSTDLEAIVTPQAEEEDPFALDCLWDDMRMMVLVAPTVTHKRSRFRRRPPPLELFRQVGGREAEASQRSNTVEVEVSAATQTSPALLSPLPIVPAGVFRARHRSVSAPQASLAGSEGRNVVELTSNNLDLLERQLGTTAPEPDIDLALDMLLMTCGEDPAGLHGDPVPRISSPSPQSSDFSETDLFYRKPQCESPDPAHDDLASAFPLPPRRPSRPEGLGVPFRTRWDEPLLSDSQPLIRRSRPPNLTTAFDDPMTPPRPDLQFDLCAPPTLSAPSKPVRGGWKPTLSSNHSALQALSRGEDIASPLFSDNSSTPSLISAWSNSNLSQELSRAGSSRSSRQSSSSSSRRSLPRRSRLPTMWTSSPGGQV